MYHFEVCENFDGFYDMTFNSTFESNKKLLNLRHTLPFLPLKLEKENKDYYSKTLPMKGLKPFQLQITALVRERPQLAM